MLNKEIRDTLLDLFYKQYGKKTVNINLLPESGSYRKYFRILIENDSIIGVYNSDIKENQTFCYFNTYFSNHGLKVPKIIVQQGAFCLLEDLGDISLFEKVSNRTNVDDFSIELIQFYKTALSDLIHFQLDGRQLDYTKCFQNQNFDKSQIIRDLNYFKYYFLKLNKIAFNEFSLDEEFIRLADILENEDTSYFMYRDFQSRNIQIKDNNLYYIDFQGGSKGPLQYDVVSLLYQAKARIPDYIKEELLGHYLNELKQKVNIDLNNFKKIYYQIAIIRTLQVLGAYGFRGIIENKSHFLKSIPFAIDNLYALKIHLHSDFKELHEVIDKLLGLKETFKIESNSNKLLIRLYSFSFFREHPKDYSGNGGGYVFDCRSLPNPGRFNEYKQLNGRDSEVIDFLKDKEEVNVFLQHCKSIINQSISNYQKRKFTDLSISFGCTGGQHRSVYCAEELSKYIRKQFDVKLVLNHIEQGVELIYT